MVLSKDSRNWVNVRRAPNIPLRNTLSRFELRLETVTPVHDGNRCGPRRAVWFSSSRCRTSIASRAVRERRGTRTAMWKPSMSLNINVKPVGNAQRARH
jgi:hypothetical protein